MVVFDKKMYHILANKTIIIYLYLFKTGQDRPDQIKTGQDRLEQVRKNSEDLK